MARMVRRSSAAEQLTVNQLVVGSIPTAGANKIKHLGDAAARCELLKHSIDTVFEFGAVLEGTWVVHLQPVENASYSQITSNARYSEMTPRTNRLDSATARNL